MGLIYMCSTDKGRGAFIAMPLIFLINLILMIIGIIKKRNPLTITSLILLFIAPVLGFIVFAINFPWIAH